MLTETAVEQMLLNTQNHLSLNLLKKIHTLYRSEMILGNWSQALKTRHEGSVCRALA